MSTNVRDSALGQSPSTDAEGRTHLRLVVGNTGGCPKPESNAELPATPCVMLKSAIVDTDKVVLNVLTNLFKHLRQHERIEFVHRVQRTDSHNGSTAQPYRLSLNVACKPDQTDDLNAKVAEAMITAYPGLHFVSCSNLPIADSPKRESTIALPHVIQFAPAGLVVAPKPAFARFEQRAERQRFGRGCATQEEINAKQQVWPFPEKLANWPLTAPLYEPLELPELVEISIRIHAFSLSEETCEHLHQTMMRVLGGNLAVFHPESPVAAYSASADLGNFAVELVRHWLCHPSGYAVDCVIRSSAVLSDVAGRRIAADVFGKRPIEMVSSCNTGVPVRLAKPTLAWACTSTQGIPALMPGLIQLPTLAVPRHYSAPEVRPPQSGALVGTTVCGRFSSAVALPYDCRSRHVAIFGSTGSGKSSLMTQMIAEDIADPHRNCGVGLIDPHGDLYQRVLSIIPPERVDDVILIDTADLLNTACLNPLEGMRDNPLLAQFIVGEIMSLIELLFESKDTSGPMLRNNLRYLLLLSISMPSRHSTFLDVVRILEDADFRDYLLSKCNNRGVVDYWENFKKTKGNECGFAEWLPYIMARLSPFVASPIMKRLLCRPNSTINLAQAMREKKIVLFNLNKGVLQDIECQVLGSLVLMKFFSAALSARHTTAEGRPAFHLYVDEFQTFATDSVPKLFSESRKYNLCLTTANQSIGQLQNRWGRTNIAESILANTATKFLFRLGPSDIDTLQPYFRPQFEAREMATLPDFHAVACMSDQNRPLPPFVMRANLVTTNLDVHASISSVIDSARRYTVPIAQANDELSRTYNLSMESLGTVEANEAGNVPGVNQKGAELPQSTLHNLQKLFHAIAESE